MNKMETNDKHKLLWQDPKFRWLVFSIAIVGVFEFLSLAGWHLPQLVGGLFFAAIIIAIGHRTLLNGLKALTQLNFKSINLLMVIAVVGAFYLEQYEEAAVVIVLFTLGERLEGFGVEVSRSALQNLIERTPKTATVKDRGEVLVTELRVGNVLAVKPSEMFAADGEVVSGSSSVDESTITGESLPKDKHPGDLVFAGTLNKQGYLEVRITRAAENTTLAKIISITFEATQNKAETQKFIEKFASYYTPTIIFAASLIMLVPTLVYGQELDKWLREALTLLVIACPCALVISTPVSIYSAIGNASLRGALVKGGKYIEAIGRVAIVAMDKTRTLTYGRPVMTDVVPFGNHTKDQLLACAAGIELFSEHPLAQSIIEGARKERLTLHQAENFKAIFGKGAKADCVICYNRHHCIGKLSFITEEHNVQQEVMDKVEELQRQGKTSIVISNNQEVEGIIAVADEIKPESKVAIGELRRLGVETVMLTGDNHIPAQVVADELKITEVRAELLPEDKVEAVRELAGKYGPVAMVGDGVNDAPALALASVGISMGSAGSDTAIETSAIVVLNDRLETIPFLIALGRRAITIIKFNTMLAVITKLLFVTLALVGISNLALAIFADVGVTVLVIFNSLRLTRFNPPGPD